MIYKTDNCELWQGDCLEIMKAIPDKTVDMVLCDPPYGTTACKWDVIIPFDDLWKQYNRIVKKNGAIVIFGSEPFSSKLRLSNLKMYKYDWVWEKNTISGFALAKKQPLRNHENISVFYSKQPTYNPIKEPRDLSEASRKRMEYDFTTTKGDNEVQGIKKVRFIPEDKELSYPKTVKKFNTVPTNSNNRVHPTQKPVALCEYLICTYTNENDLVLDNCMGSGSSGVAAINTNRRFIGIELDTTYCGIAKKRIQDVDTKCS